MLNICQIWLILYLYNVFSGCKGLIKVDDIVKLYTLILNFISVTGIFFIHNDLISVNLDVICFTSMQTLNI